MRRTKFYSLSLTVLIVLAIFVITTAVSAGPDQARHRLIAHTVSRLDKLSFKLQGCNITHELGDATALDCPENVNPANAEPDAVLHVLDLTADQQINADKVWTTLGDTGSGVTVAVLDTGIDSTHQEFGSSGGSIDGQCFATTAKDCGNGFLDDNGHGTHVSGIITADGVIASAEGVAPGANIWMAKVCDGSGSCYTSDIVAAIQDVVTNKRAEVMSISLGGGGTRNSNCDSDYLASQINWAYNNGVVAVVAAGNSGNSTVSSPACASKAIAVAAVDRSDNRASFSSYGNALKDHGVAAPGVSIYSTLPGNSYASWSGTSMATPHVSAAIALMLWKNPSLTPANIRSTIFSSANCLNNKYGACPNIYIGFGRVDALKAVSPATSLPSLSLSASPSAITTTQSSAITVSTSDIKSGLTISLATNLGSLTDSSCISDSTGKCTVNFSSTAAGTATITATATGYTSASTKVTISRTRTRGR